MKKLTIQEIRSFSPCYDPVEHLKEGWKGTLTSLLKNKKIPAKDRLWVVVRHQLLSDKQLHAYGLACAKLCEKNSEDKRVKECNKVTARFLKGKASLDELSASRSAAESARSAAWSATWSARSAAWSAAESAAWSAWSAAESATWSAWSASRSAADEKQCIALIKILKSVK